ncbi:MAG: polysaccharide biosynthesis/export family protein [Bacteroidota bacterium]
MKRLARLLPVLLMIYFATSCIPLERLSYVQTDKEVKKEMGEDLYFFGVDPEGTIRPGDELYIRVTSSDESPTSFSESDYFQVRDPSLLSYDVDEEGYIKLPYINRIKVSDLTLREASEKIEEELSQYLYFPAVFIKFVNNKVTILGEVNTPGVYVFNYKTINILQAIGYANDITEWGNRRKVLLIREDGTRKFKTYIDLTKDDLLSSDYYLIKSNDIIYIEPLKRKKWGMNTVPYNLILSIISTAIVVMTFVNTN